MGTEQYDFFGADRVYDSVLDRIEQFGGYFFQIITRENGARWNPGVQTSFIQFPYGVLELQNSEIQFLMSEANRAGYFGYWVSGLITRALCSVRVENGVFIG